MSNDEKTKFRDQLIKGLELAEYRMLKEKAMHNQIIIQSDGNGGVKEIPARELFVRIYNEQVPSF